MRIVQVVSPAATLFDRKLQRVDFAGLRGEHDVSCITGSPFAVRRLPFDVAHFYGEHPHIELPRRRRWSRAKAADTSGLPEAVEEQYFSTPVTGDRRPAIVGCVARKSIKNIVEQTAVRLHRTREDIEILAFHEPPTPDELATVTLWVDPATEEHDYDGYVAEALVSGLPVVASRTAMNVQRLEKGRIGFLVPPNDPNELAHAILSALFKPEVAQQKIEAARQTRAKFRPRQRLRSLIELYESLRQ